MEPGPVSKLQLPFFMDVAPDKIPKVDRSVAGYIDEEDEELDIEDELVQDVAEEANEYSDEENDMEVKTQLGNFI